MNPTTTVTTMAPTDPHAIVQAFAAADIDLTEAEAACIARGFDDQALPPIETTLDSVGPEHQEAAFRLMIQCSPRAVESVLRGNLLADPEGRIRPEAADCVVENLLAHPDLAVVIRHSVAGTAWSEDCFTVLFDVFAACT